MKRCLKRIGSLLVVLMLLVTGSSLLVSCGDGDEGPMEEAGEKVDDAANETGDALEDAGEATEDAVEDAGDAVEDATDNN